MTAPVIGDNPLSDPVYERARPLRRAPHPTRVSFNQDAMRTTPSSRPPAFVAALRRRSRVPPSRAAVRATALVAAFLAACATAPQAGPPDPGLEARAVAATTPDNRIHVVFDWHMTDRDARFSGQGSLRLDHGYRARVDLFGPRGETLAAAVVEGEVMRVVPAGAESLLPPPAMLWSALGVFRAPADAPLTGSTLTDNGFTLAYAGGDARWTFGFHGDALRSAEWSHGRSRRTVVLTGEAQYGLPGQAIFRDWAEFRELTLRLTDVQERTAFEPDVWVLPGGY
jgi:hypothetical protein